MILILIHHIHLLMYVPTIAVIVVLRYYLLQGFSRQNVLIGIAAMACVGALFLAAQFWGTMAVRASWVWPFKSTAISTSRSRSSCARLGSSAVPSCSSRSDATPDRRLLLPH